jgi:hypothetical protein
MNINKDRYYTTVPVSIDSINTIERNRTTVSLYSTLHSHKVITLRRSGEAWQIRELPDGTLAASRRKALIKWVGGVKTNFNEGVCLSYEWYCQKHKD